MLIDGADGMHDADSEWGCQVQPYLRANIATRGYPLSPSPRSVSDKIGLQSEHVVSQSVNVKLHTRCTIFVAGLIPCEYKNGESLKIVF